MNSKELAYAKQGALSAKSWDTFQTVIRKCLKAAVSPLKSQKSVLSTTIVP